MKIKEESYSSGIVCFLDILGFKSVAENEDNFKSLKDIYNKILNKEIIINNYMEYKDLKMSIFSDSIILTCNIADKEINLVIEAIIELVFSIRNIIIKDLNTDIRCGICYGKYIHQLSENFTSKNLANDDIICKATSSDSIYFGPAIISAYSLAEKSDKYYPIDILKKRPAAILIDKTSFYDGHENKLDVDYYFENLKQQSYIENVNDYCDLDANIVSKKNEREILIFNSYKYDLINFKFMNKELFVKHIIEQTCSEPEIKKKYELNALELINALKYAGEIEESSTKCIEHKNDISKISSYYGFEYKI